MSSSDLDQREAADGPPHTSTLQEYIYQPLALHHIRLLHITKNSEELHIVHTRFESAPAYTAVSYTWNDEPRDQPMLVDGCSLKVINNFCIALPHLAKAAKTQYLWVDGLCINQKDDEERAVQVPFMREIYTLSHECLVWLGESTLEAEIAIDAMPRISRNLELYGALQAWDLEGIGVRSPGTPDSALWKGFANIFSRPWFKRVWTFQEGVLPPTITFLFSTRVVAFDDMAPLANPLLNHLTSLQHFYAHPEVFRKQLIFIGFLKTMHICKFRNSTLKYQNCLDTLRLLYFTRPWSSTNPLDKVYGLLGLTDPSFQRSLVVNYSKSVIEVSIEIAQWYLEYGEDLFILNLASSFRVKGVIGLPSWIPHFGLLASHWCIGVIWSRFRTGIDRSRHRKSATMIGQKLNVGGIRIDEVSHIVPCIGNENRTRTERHHKILEWEEQCLAISRSLFQDEPDSSVPEAHWTTMISAICDSRITPSKVDYDSLKAFLKAVAMAEPLCPELETRTEDFSFQVRRLSKTARTGHFFRTVGGRIGIGSNRIQPRDQICVFNDGFTPFVLRPLPGSDSEYELVSDSYIFGFMHGEAFKEEAGFCDETFVLV